MLRGGFLSIFTGDHLLRAWKARLPSRLMPRLRRIWQYLTQPWLAPMLRQVVLCRVMLVVVTVIGVAHLLGWSLWVCLFSKVTGLPCPGCGMTRAIAALLHGEWRQALLYHPFSPGFALLGLLLLFCAVMPGQLRERVCTLVEKLEHVTKFAAIFLLAALIYGLLRMGGLCSNHAAVKPLPFMSRHFGQGQESGG